MPFEVNGVCVYVQHIFTKFMVVYHATLKLVRVCVVPPMGASLLDCAHRRQWKSRCCDCSCWNYYAVKVWCVCVCVWNKTSSCSSTAEGSSSSPPKSDDADRGNGSTYSSGIIGSKEWAFPVHMDHRGRWDEGYAGSWWYEGGYDSSTNWRRAYPDAGNQAGDGHRYVVVGDIFSGGVIVP